MKHVKRKPLLKSKDIIYVLIASIIPLAIYLNRFLIPDESYDTLYYHLFNGERSLHNYLWPFSSREFYPAGFGTLPAIYDLILYIGRLALGYRLGNILSLLAYFLIIVVVLKIFLLLLNLSKPKIKGYITLIFLLNAVLVMELLFQLATYFVDIIDTLAVLVALYWFLIYLKQNKSVFLFLSALLFGISFLAKQTNIIYLLPFLAMAIYAIWASNESKLNQKLKVVGLVVVLSIAPTIIYDIWNVILTGNPVFPLYNGIFKSSYYSKNSFSPTNYGFGGTNLLQKVLWPIFMFWHSSRLPSPHNIFNDWKLPCEWIILLSLFIPAVWRKLNKLQHYLVIFFYTSMLIWGLTSGIPRYEALGEIVGGVLIFSLFIVIKNKISSFKQIRLRYGLSTVFMFIVFAIILFCNFRIVKFNLKYDMSFRPTFIYDKSIYVGQAKYLFDNNLTYPNSTRSKLANSQIYLNCLPQTTGLVALSGFTNKPVLNLLSLPPNQQMISQKVYRQAAASKLINAFHEHNLSFAALIISDRAQEDFQTCMNNINLAGGQVESLTLLNSFLGYTAYEKPVVILGTINLNDYQKYDDHASVPYKDPSKIPTTNQQELINYLVKAY